MLGSRCGKKLELTLREETFRIMNPDHIRQIARRLKLNAPDMRSDSQYHLLALSRSVGKLSRAIAQLETASADNANRDAATAHCGASILVLFSLMENFGLDLDAALKAGEQELQ
jgi:hypothetical protein